MTLIVLIVKVQIKTDKNFLKSNLNRKNFQLNILLSFCQDKKLTKIRKIFHLLILIVFLLGFMHDRSLLFLCSYGMLILFILLEVLFFFYLNKNKLFKNLKLDNSIL